MALNPTLRLMVDNAHAKYGTPEDPLARKRAELLAKAADFEAGRLSVSEHLMVLGLRKASKDELRRIILDALAVEVAA